MLLFQFSICHGLSARAFGDLLHLMIAHLPRPAKIPKTVYTLKKFFVKLFPDDEPDIHSCCSDCCRLRKKPTDQCPTSGCSQVGVTRFVSINLEHQLRRKLEGE